MRKNGNRAKSEEPQETTEGVNRIVSEVKEKGKTLLNEGLENARQIFEGKADAIKEKAGEWGDKTVDEISEDVKYYVRRHPLQSIGITFGLGVLIGALFKSD